MQPPALLRRMSPVPKPGQGAIGQSGAAGVTGRGQSPVLHNQHGHPMKVQNSRELQAHINQQMQSLSIFPPEGGGATEPPPPYPMGSVAMAAAGPSPVTVGGSVGAGGASSTTAGGAAPPPPPPSYSQSLAMRQSPTLSSASSDYRSERTSLSHK